MASVATAHAAHALLRSTALVFDSGRTKQDQRCEPGLDLVNCGRLFRRTFCGFQRFYHLHIPGLMPGWMSASTSPVRQDQLSALLSLLRCVGSPIGWDRPRGSAAGVELFGASEDEGKYSRSCFGGSRHFPCSMVPTEGSR